MTACQLGPVRLGEATEALIKYLAGASALRSDKTNGTSLSGNRSRIETYVENHRLYREVYTIEQNLIEANSARFKAECNLLHIRMFGGTAGSKESQRI